MPLGGGYQHSRPVRVFNSNPSSSIAGTKSDVREMQAQVDKLELVVEALWRQLKRHTELTDEDLIETVSEIDLEDGQYDGKKAKKSFRECPSCQRRINRSHSKCFYCGEVLLADPFG
ncbi:hypothetical protein DDZ13_06115 [Coraliomargarita sinensis]|uniref:Uncharacterized protein n=1 Tax=Coraliomargarita sinensis TaxID=2174842 RepID=A0A317ZIE6_9BACT|nr:hypothetical protein [Coraliomargarita sinensis]PXA04742.1 hypothetical protein DDZ13_06115 [Coraliomargarita sinensis]